MPAINKPALGPFTRAERILITIPVLTASLLHAVNMTTAYVALPSIQGNLSATPSQVGWVITAFVVASAVGTILTGWLSAVFGRRRVFLGSIVGFTLTALLCASADSLTELVLYRAIQGFVSAPLLPISQSIMLDTYPRAKLGFAMSIWSLGMIIGPIMGPSLGAALTEWYNWRYVFFMNVPLGLIALAGVYTVLPEAERKPVKLDWTGVTALIVGVCALQLLLDRGQTLGWFESREIQLEAAIAVMGFYVLVVHCLTANNPYINLTVFADRNFVVGLCLIFVFGICAFSTMLVLPLFLQTVQAYPVLTAGWILSIRGIGTMLAMLTGGLLADRMSGRYLVMAGLVCIAVSNAWMTGWTADVSIEEVLATTLLSGFGMGMMWVTLTTVTFSTLPQQLRVEGATLFALVRAVGASMGTSVAVALIVHSTQVNYIELRDHVTPFNGTMQLVGVWSGETTSSLLGLYNLIVDQARVIGFLNTYLFLTAISFATLPLIFLLRTKRATSA